MSEYFAKSDDSLAFQLKKGDEEIGKLTYKSWFRFSAIMDIAHGKQYHVEPKGFWGTTIELKDGDQVLLKFAMNWSGQIIIQTLFDGREKDFVFKQKNFFRDSYILHDKEGTELLLVKPKLKWNKVGVEYKLTTTDIFDSLPNREILLMILVHCSNYYMSMMMATTVPGA